MIWKKEHLSASAKQSPNLISKLITTVDEINNDVQNKGTKRIGIVGGGPKGMYALERLLHAIQQTQTDEPIQVLWFNENPHFASGNNYAVHQPDNLLINYCIGNIDSWLRDEVNKAINEQLSLTDWVAKHQITDAEVAPTDFASRALVGYYLQDMLAQLHSSLPNQVTLSLIVGTVADISYTNQFKISLANTDDTLSVDYLLLATGHCYQNVPPFKISRDDVPQEYVASAYPVNRLDAFPKGQPVAVMGLGLTFIDICLQLTEGRGGVFTESGTYIPSGEEPVIYPFSRSNILIQPRGPIYGDTRYAVRANTKQALQDLVDEQADRKIDFQQEVLPILNAEVQFAYYSALLKSSEEEAVEKYINELSSDEIFTIDQLLFPKKESSGNQHQMTKTYLDKSIKRAEEGELHNPFMAAAAVWRELTPQIGELYNFGGFTAESHEYLDKQMWSACCRTSFGPPIANMKKISALADAGIIQFTIPPQSQISYDADKCTFKIGNEEDQQTVSYLIDGRIARSEMVRKNSPLYDHLLDRGLIEIFENDTYQPGCIAIEQDGRTTANFDNQEIPLYFYGTPTEGILFDNDSLSRVRNNLASPWADRILQLINTHDIYAQQERS